MANKLSTIFGSDSGGGTASTYVDTSAFPLIDYQEVRSSQFSSGDGGISGWNQYAQNISNVGDLSKASANQFGFNFQSTNDQDTNKIYHTIVPFQVDDNGNVSLGTASTIENSSGTSVSTTFCRRGFNNTTPNTIGSGNIPGNCAGFISYGRQYWAGGYQMMSWGGRINNSNTVATHDRNNYSDYTSSYPHPNEGTFGMNGGGNNTPYYSIVGYDPNSYNYWSGWYYNSGSYPSHWTNNQLATYSSTSGFHNYPQADDSIWDWAGWYKYYYTGGQFGFGTVTTTSNYSNQNNNNKTMWPGYRDGTNWNTTGWRFKADLAIIFDPHHGRFYTNNPANNSMDQGYGSPLSIDMNDRNDFRLRDSNFWRSNRGGWNERNRKPWVEPETVGSKSTIDELVYDGYEGFVIRRVTWDASSSKLKSKIIYHKPNTYANRTNYESNGFNPEVAQWCRAGSSNNILVTWEYRDTPAAFIIRTYDITNMLTKLELATDPE